MFWLDLRYAYVIMYYNVGVEEFTFFEVKVRKIGTNLGVINPKGKLVELRVTEGDTLIIKKIEKPVKEIRGILKGTGFTFKREAEDRDRSLDHAYK